MPLGKETERYSGGDMVGARRSALRGWRRHPGGGERREKDMRQMVSAGWALDTATAPCSSATRRSFDHGFL